VKRRRQRRRWALLGVGAALCLAVVLGLRSVDALHPLELNATDARLALRGHHRPDSRIVIVALDTRTVSILGQHLPLPRSLHARLIDVLHAAHARLIAYDIQFIGQTTPAEDRPLLRAISAARPMVVATHDDGGPPLRVPAAGDPVRLGATLGSVAVQNDADGKIRRMLYEPVALKSFDVQTASLASGRAVGQEHFVDNTAWIDYAGPPETYPTYSMADALSGRIPARTFTGKIVLVGVSDPIQADVFPTPTSNLEMAGVEVHANAIATILAGFPLRPVAPPIDDFLIVALIVIPCLGAIRRGALGTLAAAAAGLAVLAVGAQVAFDRGWIATVTYPALGAVLAASVAVTIDFFVETRERRRLRTLFARFVGVDVVDDVIERTDEDLRLGGVRRIGTVMFTDLRGFTSFSESLAPERVVEVVNQYLTEMSEAILDHGGTLVSYMGDGIMALFGAPLEQADHADRAVAAAREMLAVRLPSFNAWLEAEGLDHEFRMGIGLNSGTVISGNVGSPRRLEYTALGDTTNTAARLEGMTKGSGRQLFIADSTRALLGEQPGDLVELGPMALRGKTGEVVVWTLTTDTPAG
jgi:adenylate cyclase